ncbi:MAG: ribonuclease HII [Bifidobacteriaceae bacterium]|nr:ribonuclease HII [Bifidobacteriaceae bacterium]
MTPRSAPTLERERTLLTQAKTVVGMDEVGRGALAGPVCVGAVAVNAATPAPPRGLDDSKALTPTERTRLAPLVSAWAEASALGWASADEIDKTGLTSALRTAGWRALDQLARAGIEAGDGIVLLDGSHDWLTPPQPTLEEATNPDPTPQPDRRWRTVTLIGADRLAACVAAASVLAKCARDAAMVQLAHTYPGYGWPRNKGYGTAEHRDALQLLGPSPVHRLTWKLVEE